MNKKLKWKTDFDKPVLIDNYTARGWYSTIFQVLGSKAVKKMKTTGIFIGQTSGT